MATSEAAAAAGTEAAAPEVNEVDNHLKRKSSDIGWEWGRLCDPNDKNRVKCLFCGQESTAGIYRLKQHLAHVGTSIVKCSKVSEEVNKSARGILMKQQRRKEISSSMTKRLGRMCSFQQLNRKW